MAATFLDTLGILNYFSALFAALLVFAVVFAALHKTKIIGENKILQSFVAIVLALLVLVYPDLIELISFIAPWFVFVFIFIILLLLTYRLFGLSESNIVDFVRSDRTVNWTLLAIGILILIAAVFNVFGDRALQDTSAGDANITADSDSDDFDTNLFSTLFNKQILGVLLLFAVAVFAIAFLGGKPPI
jgi:hypothetical protein